MQRQAWLRGETPPPGTGTQPPRTAARAPPLFLTSASSVIVTKPQGFGKRRKKREPCIIFHLRGKYVPGMKLVQQAVFPL